MPAHKPWMLPRPQSAGIYTTGRPAPTPSEGTEEIVVSGQHYPQMVRPGSAGSLRVSADADVGAVAPAGPAGPVQTEHQTGLVAAAEVGLQRQPPSKLPPLSAGAVLCTGLPAKLPPIPAGMPNVETETHHEVAMLWQAAVGVSHALSSGTVAAAAASTTTMPLQRYIGATAADGPTTAQLHRHGTVAQTAMASQPPLPLQPEEVAPPRHKNRPSSAGASSHIGRPGVPPAPAAPHTVCSCSTDGAVTIAVCSIGRCGNAAGATAGGALGSGEAAAARVVIVSIPTLVVLRV
jgi:hypothetical protein